MILLQVANPVLQAFGQNARPRQELDTPTSILILAGIVLFVVVLVLVNNRSGKSPAGASLKKLSRQHGLDRTQYRMLKKSVTDLKVSNHGMIFSSGKYMNAFLRKIFAQVDQSGMGTAEKEAIKAEFFEIRRRITYANQGRGAVIPSTKNIPLNQGIRILSKNFPPFPSTVTGKTSEFLVVDHPVDGHGDLVRYAEGMPLKIRFQRDADKIFTFVSTVAALKQIEGSHKILINHTDKIQRVQLRQAPRKEFTKKAYFSPVELVTEGRGRKAQTRALVNRQRRYTATFMDISSGGCGLISRTSIPKGSPIMVTFDLEQGNSVEVLGKVRNIRRQRNGTFLMNVAFTRVPNAIRNKINTYVYGIYEEDTRSSSILTRPLVD